MTNNLTIIIVIWLLKLDDDVSLEDYIIISHCKILLQHQDNKWYDHHSQNIIICYGCEEDHAKPDTFIQEWEDLRLKVELEIWRWVILSHDSIVAKCIEYR